MAAITKIPDITPSVELMAYTAGLLDGEGSIQINGTRNGQGATYWGLTVQITNVGDGFLEEVRARWGEVGSVTYSTSRGSREGRRICNWRLYSAQADWFLRWVQPYVVLKRAHVANALEFRQYVAPHKNWLTPERLEQRERIALEMRRLNAATGKGRAAVSKPQVF